MGKMDGKKRLKRKEKQKGAKEKQRKAEAEPLEEKQEGRQKELKLKREAAKLVEEAKGDWEKLGEALYGIYKRDKKKAFEIIEPISRDEKLRNGIKASELKDEQLNEWLVKEWLDLLRDKKLKFSLDDEKLSKAVLGLAALSGLREIKGEEDVKKAFAITVLREAVKSDLLSQNREAAAILIGELSLQKELKAELMLLMFDGWYKASGAAEEVWEKDGLGDVKAEYEAMDEEEKERVKELIREAARSDYWDRQEAAAKLIGELGLEKELLDPLMKLAYDKDLVVSHPARKALVSWVKKIVEEVKEDKAHLANPFTLTNKEELKEELFLAIAGVCL